MEKLQSNPVLRKYTAESKKIIESKIEKIDNLPKMPKKADFRMRAHCNPLSDTPFPL